MTDPAEPEENSKTVPADGERWAQHGYQRQYLSSGAIIYDSLQRNDLSWIGVADRRAGIVDDLVLGTFDTVIGHQFKSSQTPKSTRLTAMLLGKDSYISALASSWKCLKEQFSDKLVEIRFVTTDYPSASDPMIKGDRSSSTAHFLEDLKANPSKSIIDWHSSKWAAVIKKLEAASGLNSAEFQEFFNGFRILTDSEADLITARRRTSDETALISQIAAVIPKLVTDASGKDRWFRHEILDWLGWPDTFDTRRTHQFPIGEFVQRNVETEGRLNAALTAHKSGYLSLLGPPGIGKSTLLQSALTSQTGTIVARYLAFMPGEGQGIGRAEAEDFYDDLIAQLRSSGLSPLRFYNSNASQRAQELEHLLKEASNRYVDKRIRTIIVVDGLDHITREERPARSLLGALPLPQSVPAGVIFVLGSQTLDLDGIPPSVRDEAASQKRGVVVAPLSREAVFRIAEAAGLQGEISRDDLHSSSTGHPLIVRYLIEALKSAPPEQRDGILNPVVPYDGNVETLYESAWRAIQPHQDSRRVLAYVARAEGAIQPELIAAKIDETAVERALASSKHLLKISTDGWQVFHNSFRLFLLSKKETKFGKVDENFGQGVYLDLAQLAGSSDASGPQRFLELRYRARAGQHEQVLSLSTLERFRHQVADGRSASDIQDDIKLAFKSVEASGDVTDLFRLLLAADETTRRADVLSSVGSIVDALIALEDIDSARAAAAAGGVAGKDYEIVDILVDQQELESARELFDDIEPIDKILGGKAVDSFGRNDDLSDWARRVFHFRDPDQILDAIGRLSSSDSRHPELENDEALRSRLRFEVARAAVAYRPGADISELESALTVDAGYHVYLLAESCQSADSLKMFDVARERLLEVVDHKDFGTLGTSWRRGLALTALALGQRSVAEKIFADLVPPGASQLEEKLDEESPEAFVLAVLRHASLARQLGQTYAKTRPSKKPILNSLEFHARKLGELSGLARLGQPASPAEIAATVKSAMAFLNTAKADASDEFYSLHQLAGAAPAFAKSIVGIAHRSGPAAYTKALAEVEASFAPGAGVNAARLDVRREVALEAFRYDHDRDAAARRLEAIHVDIAEDTPEEQVEQLSKNAEAFALVGIPDRAREILLSLRLHTLGYSRPPKKDPQYSLWEDLYLKSCEADPDKTRERSDIMLRLLDGLMQTEGRNAGYRVAPTVIRVAMRVDARYGLDAAKRLVASGASSWPIVVDRLLRGLIRRRSDLVAVASECWKSVCLPFYSEPHFSESELGKFIAEAVQGVAEQDLPALVSSLQHGILTVSSITVRSTLLKLLEETSRERSYTPIDLQTALAKCVADAPPAEERSSTPEDFYDVFDFDGLLAKWRTEQGEKPSDGHPLLRGPSYTATRCCLRLIKGRGTDEAKTFIQAAPEFLTDSRIRFEIADAAAEVGDSAYARELANDYLVSGDERAKWNYWEGGGKIRYYKLVAKLDGDAVKETAFKQLAHDLASSGEFLGPLLWDIVEVAETTQVAVDWVAMWRTLQSQLEVTRDFLIGSPFEPSDASLDDLDFLASIYEWAYSTGISELLHAVQRGLIVSLDHSGGLQIFRKVVDAFLAGDGDQPLAGMRFLNAASGYAAVQAAYGASVPALANNEDFSVCQGARWLARQWSVSVDRPQRDLPAFYSIIFDSSGGSSFDRPSAVDNESKAMIVEDRYGWTFALKRQITFLSDLSGISVAQLRQRSQQLIQRWGGIEKFGARGAKRLLDDLKRLEMKLTYQRPDMLAGMRSVRFVAQELSAAGLIPEGAEFTVSHLLGAPWPSLPVPEVVQRPEFVSRPSLDPGFRDEEVSAWLSQAWDDLEEPPQDEFVLAELATYERRHIRRGYTMQRLRLPRIVANEAQSYDELYHMLDSVIWADRFLLLSPTSDLVVRVDQGAASYVPDDLVVLNPQLAGDLGWTNDADWTCYLTANGEIAARVRWWRDGSPQSVDIEHSWGEGAALTLTEKGKKELEAKTGPLRINSIAWRTVQPERGGGNRQVAKATSSRLLS